MATSFVFAPLSAPHNQPNMLLLLVVNDELKTRIQAIRQALVLHDAVSTSVEFTGIFVRADEPMLRTQENAIEDLIAWFGENTVPISSGVLTILPHGVTASAVPIGQADETPMCSDIIPYTFLESDKTVTSLLPQQHIMTNEATLLQ